MTKKSSFLNVQKWLLELRQYAEPDCVVMLVGNKIDLVDKNLQQREVFTDEVKHFIEENKLLFYETSALANEKVNEAFEDLLFGNIVNKIEIYSNKQKAFNNNSKSTNGYTPHGNFIKISKNGTENN